MTEVFRANYYKNIFGDILGIFDENGTLVVRYYYDAWGRNSVGCNLFAYCGNDPVNRIDPLGEAWWHWALGAAVVIGCAVATVVTFGGFAAAATAVCFVSNGVAAAERFSDRK